ncbi:uncharacterized protein LOC127713038 [Mytilus californianus]|uniref:uncharacterized protein LOC127713038 n=1 Tax=Mytilus californianus TaxID=6549 RepID=UPI0022478337|nr:uncharacterized protein LOC127713038 [Mytilus californianus]
MEQLEINVRRELPSTKKPYLREIGGILEVFIPVKDIGLHQVLKSSNSTTVHLKRCSTKASAVFQLSLEDRVSNRKPYLTVHCSLEETICHVQLKHCQTKGRKLRVTADKISVAPKAMTCERLELECNLNMVVHSIMVCPYISLKSNHEVRLSVSARLKTETLKLAGKTVFIDGQVKYHRHFQNKMTNESNGNGNILGVHVCGYLHTGRDSVMQCCCRDHKSKNITGTLQLHVEGDICNHGTIEASELMEVKCKSLLSCRKCDKDTANRYLSSIKHKHCTDEHDILLPSNIQLGDAVKRLDTKLIFVMLKHGFDPYSPIEIKGATLTSTTKKLQWEMFCPQEKYDNDYTNLKLQVDNFVSLIESWNKQRGSIISPEISFKMYGDFEDLSQVKCKQIFLEINGNICVENESICTLGCISGICKGDTRINGQMKLGSFESFETNDFSIYETGSLIIQNGGNISVDNCFHNGSLVYNLNNKLSIYTGVFQQENESQITSQEDLEIDICKESRIVNGSFDARDLYLGISARVTEWAVIKSMNSCTLEFKENKNTKEYGSLNHKGCIEVDNGHVLMSSTANVYDVKLANSELVIQGKGEFYNRTGGILQCTHGPLRIQNVCLLANESGASIFGKSIKIATAVVGHKTDTLSKKHDLKNNGKINSPGVVKIFAGNLKNHGTIQSHYSQVEIHYTTMKNVITKLEGILLSTEGLTVFVHNAPTFHCSFRGGSDLRKSSISLPKKGMWIKCTRGTVFFHNAIEGDAQLLVESKKGFVTLNHITITILCLEITNVYEFTNKENNTDPRHRQEISNEYEVLYDRTNMENHTVLHRHPEIANGHEVLYDQSEMENYTEFRQDKHAYINILNRSLLRTEYMIVESNCKTIEIEVRTNGDGEMIVRHDFVCEPELTINGRFTMSSSSLITAEKMITTERSVCKINGTNSELNEEICKVKTSGNIELKGHIHCVHNDRSVPSLLVVESQCGNITVMGIVQVPNLRLLTGPSQKLIIESQMHLDGYVCIGGACETTIDELSNIVCHKLIYQLTSEKSETRKIHLDLNGSVIVHGPVNLDHIDDIVMFGTLSCHGMSAKNADVIMTTSSKTEIYYFEESVEEITNSYQILTLNNLFTEKESQMKLHSDNERIIPSLIISKWQHHGDLEVNDSGSSKHKHAVRCQCSNFFNHGKCVNIDSLYLDCDNTLSNFSSLSVTDVLDINVVENIINNKGARLECTNGPLSISTKADIVNNGILISNDVNKIWAAIITNAGIIESYKSTVELSWGSKEKVSIDGKVKSLFEIQFSSPFSKEFHFCCSGGMSNDSDRFVIPANGIKLKCTKGSVVLKMDIEGRQKSANVSVLCMDGCKMHKNLTTSVFHLERTFGDEKMLGNQKLTIDSLSETKAVSPDFYLWLKEDCTFVSRNLKAQTGSQNVTFFIRTDESSKLVCYEQILNLDSLLFIQGNIEISFYSQIRARSISLDKDSIVKVFAEEQIDPKCFLFEPTTTDNNECKLLSEMDIEIDGNISSFKDDQIKASIISNSGDVIIKGEVDVPHLQIAAAVDKSTHFHGMVNTSGRLYLSRGRIIDIDDHAVLRCKAFSCEPKMNKSDRLAVNGQLHVMGSAHFVVESLYISRGGQVVIISENSKDHVVLEDVSTVDIKGRFECRIQGDCLVDCKRSLSLSEKSVCLFSVGECNLIASEIIRMDDTCKIELEKGKLYIGNAREEDTTIHGSVELSGIICGKKTDTMVEIEGHCVSFRNFRIQDIHTADLFAAQSLFVDSNSKVSNVEKLEIQATSIDLKGLIKNTPRIKILAESSLLIDKESKINNDNQQKSELSLQVTATTVEMKGHIQYLKNIDGEAKMHFDASNMLIMGKINSEGEIKIEADCSFVNNGQVRCTKIGIVAPICLNCPQNFDKLNVEHISQLGGENQKILVIEGLLCIIVGSFLHSKSINIKSVLNFQFSAKMSTIPQAGDLERWKSVVDSSLSKISMANTPEDIHKLTEQTIKIQQVICDLSVSSHLCEDVVKICEKISKGGLGQFDMNEMITSLDNAHSFYSKIIPLELNVDFVRIKYRSLKKRGKKVAKNLINKIFGPNSFSKSLEFPQNNLDQGIRIDSFINEGKHTDIRSDGYLFFASLKFQGRTGLWKNDGYIEACGDIIISASKIKQLGGQGRIMKAITGSIRLTGDNAEVKNLESKHLHVDVSQEANLQSIKTEGQAVVQGNNATIQNIDSKTLHVKAQQEVQINTANIQQDMSVISQRIAAGNVKSKQLDLKAIENITLDNVSTKEIATLESGNTINARNIKVTELNTTSKGNTDFGEIKADKMDAVSKCGNITLHEKSKVKEAKLEAKHGDISLTGNNKKANHEFGCLTLNTRALEDINKLLNRSDVYKDLKIADHLGLIVEDQNVIIATQQKSQFSLSIKAASIDVRKGMDAKNLELATTKGILKIDKNVKIKAKENVRLTSRGKLHLCERSSVSAGQNINLESEKDSVSLSASELDAGSGMKIKAHHDIIISSDANGGPCEGSKLSAGRTNKEQSAIDIEAERKIKIHASDIKSQGENTFKAGNNISITANKYETTKRKTKSSWFGLCRSTTETTMTHVEKSTIVGRLNVFKAGGSFTSVAGNIKSEFGNDIRATGGISMLDLQTTTKTKETSSILGIKYYQKDESSQQSQGTSLEDSSSEARTSIISETSNIEWQGSSLNSSGNVSEIAEMGKITHSRRLLNHETNEKGIKVFTQKSTKDKERSFGIEAIYERGSNQTTSTDSTNIGGDYTVKAKKVNVLNSANIDVKGNMNVRTDDLRIEGASLEASNKRVNIGIGIESSIATVSANYEKGEQTTQQMQKLHVGGTLHLDNVKNATIDTSNIDSGGLTGQVDILDIQSRLDRKSGVKLGFAADIDLVTRSLCGGGIDIGLEGDERITQPTSIDVNGGSKELSVGTLETKGASIVFDGDVHKFAQNIVSHSVHEKAYEFNLGFRLSKPNKMSKRKKKLVGNINFAKGQYHSCVASTTGTVDSFVAKQVETDLSKRRQVDQSLSFSFSAEFEGKISQHITRIGKDLVKAVGKEAIQEVSHILATKLGIPQDIINSLVCIVEGGITQDKIFEFLKANLDSLKIPGHFSAVLQSLLVDGNPENLISWICDAANIDKKLFVAIIGIVRGKTIKRDDILTIVKHTGKYFGLSEELFQFITIIISSCDNKRLQQNQWTIVEAFFKSKEGQRIIKEVLNAMHISEEINDFLATILIKPNNFEKAMFCLHAVGQRVGISKSILEVLKDMLQGKTNTTLVNMLCNAIGLNTNLTATIELSLNDCCNMKSAVISFITSLSTHIGLSSDMAREIKHIIDGNMPECEIQTFVLEICIQISKSSVISKENPVTQVFEKLLPLASESAGQITNAINLGKQILHGEIPTAGIPLLLFLLRHVRVEGDTINAIKDFAKEGNVDVLIAWLSKKSDVNQSVLNVLGTTIMNDCSVISIFNVIFITYSKKHDLHPAIRTDLELIMNAKPPEQKLKEIRYIFDQIEDTDKRSTVFTECKAFGADVQVSKLIWNLLQAGTPEDMICQCFMSIAIDFGLPEGFVRGVIELDQKKDCALLTSWITEAAGTTGELVTFVLNCIVKRKLDYTSLVPVISSIGRMIGLSKNKQHLLESILEGNISVKDIGKLFVHMLFTIIKPYIPALANGFGIPPDILVRLVDLEDPFDPCELFLAVAEIVSAKIGIPLELPRSIKSIIFKGDCEPISECLGKWINIDSKLLLTILQTIQKEKSQTTWLKKIPICIAKYYNISEKTIECFQSLLNGKTPLYDTKETIVAIIQDTLKIFISQEQFDTLLQLFERRLGISKEFLYIVTDLLKNDKEKLKIKIIQWGCKNFGIDERIVPIILKIFDCEKNLNSVVAEVVGGIGEYFGIHSAISIDLKKVLTGQKPKKAVPSLILEIFLQVAKSVEAKAELIELLETIKSLTQTPTKQTDNNVILDKLKLYIPMISDELAIPSDIIERLVVMRYPFKLSDLSSILIEILTMKAGVSQDILQAVQVYVFKGETNLLCRWISEHSKIDKKLISSILKSLLNEKTLLEGMGKIHICISHHYDFSTETIGFLQSLVDGKIQNCDIKLIIYVLKDMSKLCLDKPKREIFDTCFAIMETPDWLERVFFLLRYFSSQLDIPEIYIDGFKDLVKDKNISTLVEHLAVKLEIDKRVLLTLVNALRNGESPKQIFKNLAKIAGVPTPAVDIVIEVIKQQGLKNKTDLASCFTKRIKWPDTIRAITVKA